MEIITGRRVGLSGHVWKLLMVPSTFVQFLLVCPSSRSFSLPFCHVHPHLPLKVPKSPQLNGLRHKSARRSLLHSTLEPTFMPELRYLDSLAVCSSRNKHLCFGAHRQDSKFINSTSEILESKSSQLEHSMISTCPLIFFFFFQNKSFCLERSL